MADVASRWKVILGALLIQLCSGAIYAWSVFTPGLKDAGRVGNFPLAFTTIGILCVVGAAASFLVFPPHHDEASKPFGVHGFLHKAHSWEKEESLAR
jgi:hypothetical protein